MFDASASSRASSRKSTKLAAALLACLGCGSRPAQNAVAGCKDLPLYEESESGTVPVTLRIENKLNPSFEIVGFCASIDGRAFPIDRSPPSVAKLAGRDSIEATLRLPPGDHDFGLSLQITGHAEVKGRSIEVVSSFHLERAKLEPGTLVARAFEREVPPPRIEQRPGVMWTLVPMAPRP